MKLKIIFGALAVGSLIGGPLLLLSFFLPFIGIPLLFLFAVALLLAVILKLSGRNWRGEKQYD